MKAKKCDRCGAYLDEGSTHEATDSGWREVLIVSFPGSDSFDLCGGCVLAVRAVLSFGGEPVIAAT